MCNIMCGKMQDSRVILQLPLKHVWSLDPWTPAWMQPALFVDGSRSLSFDLLDVFRSQLILGKVSLGIAARSPTCHLAMPLQEAKVFDYKNNKGPWREHGMLWLWLITKRCRAPCRLVGYSSQHVLQHIWNHNKLGGLTAELPLQVIARSWKGRKWGKPYACVT